MARFGRGFVQAATQPAYMQGLFTAAQNIGAAPTRVKELQKKEALKSELAGLDPTTVEGLKGLVGFYQRQGDMENALKYATALREMQTKEAEKQGVMEFREKVATAAETAGLTDQAATARSTLDMDELRGISNDIREYQISKLDKSNPAVINAQLKAAGFTPAQLKAMGTLTAEEAKALLEGRTGKLEAWKDQDNNIQAVNVNKFGLVYDDNTNKYVKASELGLVTKAPQVQEVIDKGQQAGEKAMAEANVNNFVELSTKAQDARNMIELIDRQTSRLEGGMPTGLAANIELNLRRFGELIGLPYDPSVTNAQEFISEAGKIVADQIKEFGSGTGLSDADREYAKLISAADITTQQEALLNLLKIRRGAMVRTVENFNGVRSATAKRVGEQNMTSFPSIAMPEEPQKADDELPLGFVLDE